MIPTKIGESQARILEHIKRRGPSTIPEIAAALDLSVETIRTHLRSLGSERLVGRQGRRRNGPGRPEIIYQLTEAAEDLFPNQEGKLLQSLAEYLAESGNATLLRAFFDDQVSRRREAVQRRLDGLEDRERLDEVARVLTEEGFMAEVVVGEDGAEVLKLCHCPMRNLVDVTREPCRAELGFIRALLGKRLARMTYIPSGDGACSYALGPTARASDV